MGATVLVLGRSGSGKSTSLRNFETGTVGIFNVLGKPMPFKRKLTQVRRPSYDLINQTIRANNLRAYVIDDSTYLMQNENFKRSAEKGYGKFVDMAVHFKELLDSALSTDDDTITYFLHHIDVRDDGTESIKTVGRMLDEKLCVEGMFPIVIDCVVKDGKHLFITENDGHNLAKAPMDMLPTVMDNDLAEVDRLIRDYWGMAPITDDQKESSND